MATLGDLRSQSRPFIMSVISFFDDSLKLYGTGYGYLTGWSDVSLI